MANIKGNGTTMGKFILIMFAGRTLALLAAKGIQLPVDQYGLAEFLGIALGFLYSVCDSYFKNSYKWTNFKKLLSIFNKEMPEKEDEIETKLEDDDPTTTNEPEVIQEDEIVVGDVTDDENY